MGASGSVMAPSPLELPGAGGKDNAAAGDHADVLPVAYRHLSHFPVLAKVARGPIKPRPNDRTTSFLKEHSAVASHIGGFLCVADRLHFLHTHKVGLSPKLLKSLFFGGPSRELRYLYCPAITPSSSACPTGSGRIKPTTSMRGGGHKSPVGSPTLGPLKNDLDKCLQLEVRYRGSQLSRAVPLRLVSSALHRVIRSWLDRKLRLVGRDFDAILHMVNKLLAVFRPTEEVWYAIVNEQAEDGATLLAYAVADARAPLPMIQQLLEIPCLDLGLPDRTRGLNPIQLAYRLGRQDVLEYFASLVAL